MKNFNYSIPTKIFFGQGKINELASNIKKYGDRVLITYGGGSIKRNGILARVTDILDQEKISYWQMGGIEPNPRIDSVRKGIEICRDHNIELILAIGGGSTIDCSKAIAAAFYYEGDPWDLLIKKGRVEKSLPLATVLTMAATGSEMNSGAVISNMDSQQKLSFGHPSMAPKFSILDPSYSYTLPQEQTAAGVADIMSHTLENYFSLNDGAFIQDRFAESLLKTCIEYGPVAIKEPDNYEARANLMWASSLAINGIISYGKELQWSVHAMEHELSAFYDITHGVGLAILTPRWMNYVLDDERLEKFRDYGVNVWKIDPDIASCDIARLAIERTYDFFEGLGLTMSLRDLGIGEDRLEEMAEAAIRHKGGPVGSFMPLDKEAILEIYRESLD